MISNVVNYILKGMEIYFSVDNNKEIFKLPYVPPDIEFESPLDYETFETTSGKILTLIGENGLKTLTRGSVRKTRNNNAKDFPDHP